MELTVSTGDPEVRVYRAYVRMSGQYCDLSRQYDPRPSPNTTTGKPNGTVVPVWTGGDIVTPLLQKLGKYDLLAFIQKYWKSQVSEGSIRHLRQGDYVDSVTPRIEQVLTFRSSTQTGTCGSTVSRSPRSYSSTS